MEIDRKQYESILVKTEALLQTIKTLHEEVYALRSDIKESKKKQRRIEMGANMRNILLTSAK